MAFQKGVSGNPKGRAKGSGKVSQYRALLDPYAPQLVQKVTDLALGGDTAALRICLERLLPPLKAQALPVNITGFSPKAGLADQGQAILKAVAQGLITPDEAASLMQAVASQGRIIEVDDLERRLAALEEQATEKS